MSHNAQSERFEFTCGGCESRLSAKVTSAGRTRRCPKCGAAVLLPSVEAEIPVAEDADRTPLKATVIAAAMQDVDEQVRLDLRPGDPIRLALGGETDDDLDDAPKTAGFIHVRTEDGRWCARFSNEIILYLTQTDKVRTLIGFVETVTFSSVTLVILAFPGAIPEAAITETMREHRPPTGRTLRETFGIGRDAMVCEVTGLKHCNLDGTSRVALLANCRVGDQVALVPQPDNAYDKFTVAVLTNQSKQLGYLRPQDARAYHRWKQQFRSAGRIIELLVDPVIWAQTGGQVRREYGRDPKCKIVVSQ